LTQGKLNGKIYLSIEERNDILAKKQEVEYESPLTKTMFELFQVAKKYNYAWSDISDIPEQGRVISFRDKVYHDLGVTVLLTNKAHSKDEFIIRGTYGLDDRSPIERVTVGTASHKVTRFNDFKSIFDKLLVSEQIELV
jgi:hypothetical protein